MKPLHTALFKVTQEVVDWIIPTCLFSSGLSNIVLRLTASRLWRKENNAHKTVPHT